MSKIYTITLAPAIDYLVKVDKLQLGITNKCSWNDFYAAGKGIHVSMMLQELGANNEALTFLSGYWVPFFTQNLSVLKLNYQVFNSLENVRINLKLLSEHETEVSMNGPAIATSEIEKLKVYLQQKVVKGDIVVLSGTIPTNISNDIYYQLAKIAKEKEALCVIDSYGQTLLKSLNAKPFLVKPNKNELALTLNQNLTSESELIMAANKLIKNGAENVLVSLGAEGAMLVNKKCLIRVTPPQIKLPILNSAGAGDSMVAGFLNNYLVTKDLQSATIFAVICGTATACSLRIANKQTIEQIAANNYTMKISKTINRFKKVNNI